MTVHEQERRVVVAYDGDETTMDALLAAAEEAALHKALLDVVYVVDSRPLGALAALAEYTEDAEAAAARVLAQLPELLPAGVRFAARVEHGEPGRALVHAAQGARLLVIGSNTHSVLGGLALGSVPLHVVTHAPCPVLVVPTGTGVLSPQPPGPVTVSN